MPAGRWKKYADWTTIRSSNNRLIAQTKSCIPPGSGHLHERNSSINNYMIHILRATVGDSVVEGGRYGLHVSIPWGATAMSVIPRPVVRKSTMLFRFAAFSRRPFFPEEVLNDHPERLGP
jgi:hypothetical protein